MLIDILQFAVLGLYITMVPGLPLALHLARMASNWRLVLALSPLLSLGANFVLLSIINVVGIRPNLVVFGVLLTAITIALLIRVGLPRRHELATFARENSAILPAALLGAFIWRRAFAGYLFIAPNQDAINHNRWIARIVDVGSALTSDSKIESPLQDLGTGSDFYPLAWHATVAVGSELSSLAIPAASLLSVALFWFIVLPAGLNALAKVWSPSTRHLGAVAALLVQLYPLVPGVPLSWGSMTSVVGVALLPAGVVASVYMLHETSRIWIGVALAAGVTIFFVHTPEAATLAVLVLIQFLTIGGERLQKNIGRLSLGVAVFAVPALWIFRGYIFTDRSSLEELFGAPAPSWSGAVGSFFAMDINASVGFSILALLFVAGLVTAAYDARERWLVYGVMALLGVYLVSGSGTGFLSRFRFLTAPWYASYERTLWVVVPFAAIISAYAIARLLPANVHGSTVNKVVFGAVASALLVVVVFQQVGTSVRQIRSGPARSAMVGPRDLDLMEEARQLFDDGEIALTFPADGTIYPFVYEGIRVTGGAALADDGESSDYVATIMANLEDLCASEAALAAFEREGVAAVFLAKRGVWGAGLWTEAEARELDGLDVVRSGDLLILLVPNVEECA